jgi:1,4-dihydroxy-2-naphthoate octaprenyltransferase
VYLLPAKNTITLLRIPFSFLLMPVFILALSQTQDIELFYAVVSFLIIHILVYPASNGYNSYIDKDESPIGGLEKPPLPTKALFRMTLFMDVLALVLSFVLIGKLFSLCILLYILASRAYSSKQIRLKKYPFLGFFVVMFFQGAFTFYMCSLGISNSEFVFSNPNTYLMIACSLQIAGAYPLTQIYQHHEDYKEGVVTLSYLLGYKGTFIFTALMFGVCNLFYYLYFSATEKTHHFYLLQLFFVPLLVFFSYWFIQVLKTNSAANYKNTMRMNIIAALCMNSCFFILFILNH